MIPRRLVAVAVLLVPLSVYAAGTPQQQCQSTKNKAAGAYSVCRQKAEASLAASGDASKYNSALLKCAAKIASAWQKAIDKAAAQGATCLDDPLTASDFKSIIEEHTDNVATALGGGGLTDCTADLASCNGDLTTCNGDLSSCNSDLSTCDGDLTTCNADLAQSQSDLSICNGSLTTCNGNYTTCSGNLSACNGNLSSCNGSLTTCNGSLSSCNGSLTTCNANYTSCSTSLSTVNSGTAAQGDVLTGKTFSSSAGVGVAGTMPNNGAVNLTPSTSAQSVAAGYHNGAGTVAGDADLVAGNIKNGVNLFGVNGTLSAGAVLKTGQTFALGSGSDGDLQKGIARSYSDNGDGTITDNTTGLMWEKKSDDGGIHDKDNNYSWGMTSSPFAMNGTMVTTFLASLNAGGGFAGHSDWRIPNVNELHSIVNYQNASPAIESLFNAGCVASCTVTTCSCTRAAICWSSSTNSTLPDSAWTVDFDMGSVGGTTKNNVRCLRAVRGGS